MLHWLLMMQEQFLMSVSCTTYWPKSLCETPNANAAHLHFHFRPAVVRRNLPPIIKMVCCSGIRHDGWLFTRRPSETELHIDAPLTPIGLTSSITEVGRHGEIMDPRLTFALELMPRVVILCKWEGI